MPSALARQPRAAFRTAAASCASRRGGAATATTPCSVCGHTPWSQHLARHRASANQHRVRPRSATSSLHPLTNLDAAWQQVRRQPPVRRRRKHHPQRPQRRCLHDTVALACAARVTAASGARGGRRYVAAGGGSTKQRVVHGERQLPQRLAQRREGPVGHRGQDLESAEPYTSQAVALSAGSVLGGPGHDQSSCQGVVSVALQPGVVQPARTWRAAFLVAGLRQWPGMRGTPAARAARQWPRPLQHGPARLCET